MKKKPAVKAGLFFERNCYSLANSILKTLASLECWKLHCGDLDLLIRISRIHTRSGSPLANTERAETSDGNGIALLERLCNGIEYALEHITSGLLGNTSCSCSCVNKILLCHL